MIHIICDRIVSNDSLLRLIGRTVFWVAPRRGDGAPNGGGPDPLDPSITLDRLSTVRRGAGRTEITACSLP